MDAPLIILLLSIGTILYMVVHDWYRSHKKYKTRQIHREAMERAKDVHDKIKNTPLDKLVKLSNIRWSKRNDSKKE